MITLKEGRSARGGRERAGRAPRWQVCAPRGDWVGLCDASQTQRACPVKIVHPQVFLGSVLSPLLSGEYAPWAQPAVASITSLAFEHGCFSSSSSKPECESACATIARCVHCQPACTPSGRRAHGWDLSYGCNLHGATGMHLALAFRSGSDTRCDCTHPHVQTRE